MKEVFRNLFDDESWSWDDLAKALVERFGVAESVEVISMLFMNEPEILKEIANWRNVQKAVDEVRRVKCKYI